MPERQLGRQYIHVETGARFEVSEISGDALTLTLQSVIDHAAAYRLGLVEKTDDGTELYRDTTDATIEELATAAWSELT